MGTTRPRFEDDCENVARLFHMFYEGRAPEFGYRTREASAVPWSEVPEQNRELMKATVADLINGGFISVGPNARNDR